MMAIAAIRCMVGVVGLVLVGEGPTRAQEPAGAPEPPSLSIRDFGVVPRPALVQALLDSPAVRRELRVTEAQEKAQEEIWDGIHRQVLKLRTEIKDRDQLQRAMVAQVKEGLETGLAVLSPDQRERLAQIQLRAQGLFAFSVLRGGEAPGSGSPGRFIDAPVCERLGMSEDQVKRAMALADEGTDRITQAARFRLPWGASERPSIEAIRDYVGRPEFRAAKEKARRDAREAWDAAVSRIEAILSDGQRARYRAMLGRPFDLATIESTPGQSEADADVLAVSRPFGGGGQRADTGFNATVARPMFTARRPRLAIDEAHNNFHTADGRYRPFADLMARDGCLVSRNTAAFQSGTLDLLDILVIANATVADPGEGEGGQGPASAFTEDECAAVQGWVWGGGALLLITDHEPFGSPSASLARRFGVLMNASGTTDPANDDAKTGGLVFARSSGLILDHPITLGRDPSERIDRVETFYGQALCGPEGSMPFLRFADTAVSRSPDGPRSAAGWAQGVALRYGAGRVVVMGEAAELSAQLSGLEPVGMNVPGIDNKQMALNIVRWLSGSLDSAPIVAASTAGPAPCPPRRPRPLSRLFRIER